MLRGPINWGDKPHRVEDAVDKMMGRLGWYGTTDYPTAKRGRVSIDMEMEDWNRDEPGESGIARATLVLFPAKGQMALTERHSSKVIAKADAPMDADVALLGRVIEKFLNKKFPRVKFFHKDSPSLEDPMQFQRSARRIATLYLRKQRS